MATFRTHSLITEPKMIWTPPWGSTTILLTVFNLYIPMAGCACADSCAVLESIASCNEFRKDNIEDCYKYNDITVLDLSFTSMDNITRETFQHLGSTVHLYLDRISVSSVDTDALLHLNNLETVSLRSVGWDVAKFVPALINTSHLIRVSLGDNFAECGCVWWDVERSLAKRGIEIPTEDDTPICTKQQALVCDNAGGGTSLNNEPLAFLSNLWAVSGAFTGKNRLFLLLALSMVALVTLVGTVLGCLVQRSKRARRKDASTDTPPPDGACALARLTGWLTRRPVGDQKRYVSLQQPCGSTKTKTKTVSFQLPRKNLFEQIAARRHSLGAYTETETETETEDSSVESDIGDSTLAIMVHH